MNQLTIFAILASIFVVNCLPHQKAGGEVAKPHQFPFQASLYIQIEDNRFLLCGGTLISKNYVLTTMNCVEKLPLPYIVLGTQSLNQIDLTEVRRVGKKVIMHEKYVPETSENNIALVLIDDVPIIKGVIEPVKLPSKSDLAKSYAGKKATVSGYGFNAKTADSRLRYLTSDVISNEECKKKLQDKFIRDSTLCASTPVGMGPCEGDQGNPLTITEHGVTKIIGIMSFGHPDGCTKGYPIGYTKVASYLDWIQKHMK